MVPSQRSAGKPRQGGPQSTRRGSGRSHENETSLPVTTPNKRASGRHGVTRSPKHMVAPQAMPTKEIADAILKSDQFATHGSTLYRFSDGTYTPDGASHIKCRVKALLEEWGASALWSSYRAKEVVEYLRVDAPSLWLRPPLDVINVKNGVLDLNTRRLSHHSPRHRSPVQLPVAYDPEAQCPAWEQFVNEVFPVDARDLAWDMVAHLMVPDTSRQQAILLEGDGGNGKSTFLQALIAFLGTANVSTLTLHKLESDRFAMAQLVGKLANICPDLPSGRLSGTSMFKALTGGDRMTAERKYGQSFDFMPFARLVFATNHAPRSDDVSSAFFDRWLVIRFPKRFRGATDEKSRDRLDQALAQPTELSGVLNKALVALPRLLEHGFTVSPSMHQAQEEFRQVTDPVAIWLARKTVETPEAMVSKDALLEAYNADGERRDRSPLTPTAFGLAMRRLRPLLQDGQRTWEGRKKVWVWVGLGLKSA